MKAHLYTFLVVVENDPVHFDDDGQKVGKEG